MATFCMALYAVTQLQKTETMSLFSSQKHLRKAIIFLVFSSAVPAAYSQGPAQQSASPAHSTRTENSTPSTAPIANTSAAAPIPKIGFEKYVLSNGLQVILHEDHRLPVVQLNLWYHVGSKNQKPGRTGFAHLFEHLMFQGSKDAPDRYLTLVEKAGANLFQGGVNGTTGADATNYYETVPSGSLEYLLWLESDRLATLSDYVDQRMLDNQRAVVKNEHRDGQENVPYGSAGELILENLYPYTHPYYQRAGAEDLDLSSASLQDVKDFFRKYYIPNNLSLVIAGDFDPMQARRYVEKYFGGIPPGTGLERTRHWIPRLQGEKLIEVHDRVPQPRVYIAWPAPAFFETDAAALDLSTIVLTDGLSSRLQKVLVYDKQLVSNVFAANDSQEIAGMYYVVATARPGIPLERVEEIIASEIKRLASEGPTPAELVRAKTKHESEMISELERLLGVSDLLQQYNTFVGEPGKFPEDVQRYREVSSEDVKRAVSNWLDTPNRLLVRFYPEAVQEASNPAVDRSKAPTFGNDSAFQAPKVQSAKLANGLQLLVVQRTDIPKVAVSLFTRAGSEADPAGKFGLASLTTSTMERGANRGDALEIESSLGDLGTSLQVETQKESSTLSFDVLKSKLAPALQIVSDVAQRPSFPEAELTRERELLLDAHAQEDKNANALAHRIAPMLAFGPDHPYGHPSEGLPATVKRLTREDVLNFHQTYWRPATSALIFVGDISLDEAIELAQADFGKWSGAAPATSIPPPTPVGPGNIFVVDRPGAAQTVVAQIVPATPRNAPDYYPLELANGVWGAAFNTRINLNLRENKGYTYGIFSFPYFYTHAGILVAEGGVQEDKTRESVQELMKELNGIAGTKPITATELQDARANRIRGYAQEFQSMARVAQKIGRLWANGMPMTELQHEPAALQSEPLNSVNAVIQKYANSLNSTLLLVGDYSKIAHGLTELNAGKIIELNLEGQQIEHAVNGSQQ